MRSWIINPLVFDGAKFAARYGLNSFGGDFSLNGNVLTVKPDAKVTDNPPIIEPPDSLVPCPAGIYVHEMRALSKKRGSVVLDGEGTTCFHIVVPTEASLSDPWFTGVVIDPGSVAFIQDKSKTVTWDGTQWK